LAQIGLGTTQTNNDLFKVDYENGELNEAGTEVYTNKNIGKKKNGVNRAILRYSNGIQQRRQCDNCDKREINGESQLDPCLIFISPLCSL
jgi:hypothetical protein